MASFPEQLETVDELEDWLSRPPSRLRTALMTLEGDFMVLGAGGKMGPTLCQMLKRALPERRVIAVSRFGNIALAKRLESHGVDVISGDLLDTEFLESLPGIPNIYYLVGMKFGATGQEPLTWAMNAWLPGVVMQRFSQSRVVALSTGNVYGLTAVDGAGSAEDAALCPVGEYANSCLGRERIIHHFSESNGNPTALIRLNYANELRYGVLVDLASKVLANEPIDLLMGWVNVIWQGDANAMIAEAMTRVASPPWVLNIAGRPVRVRDLCLELGRLSECEPRFVGDEAEEALLSDGSQMRAWFDEPCVPLEVMSRWIIHWLRAGGETLGKPTRFENREGKF